MTRNQGGREEESEGLEERGEESRERAVRGRRETC